MKPLLRLLAVLLLSLPMLARVSEYKRWPLSPQGFYMTKVEREQWSKIKNDDEAKKFIDEFRAKRSPEFLKMVAERAAKADQYLTVGKNPGSDSLRGKIVIVLGAPGAMHVEAASQGHAQVTTEGHGNPAGDSASAGAIGVSGSELALAAQSSGMTSPSTVNYYTFTYPARAIPGRDKELLVVVAVNPATGADRIADHQTAAELDEIFERIAQASIVTAPNH